MVFTASPTRDIINAPPVPPPAGYVPPPNAPPLMSNMPPPPGALNAIPVAPVRRAPSQGIHLANGNPMGMDMGRTSWGVAPAQPVRRSSTMGATQQSPFAPAQSSTTWQVRQISPPRTRRDLSPPRHAVRSSSAVAESPPLSVHVRRSAGRALSPPHWNAHGEPTSTAAPGLPSRSVSQSASAFMPHAPQPSSSEWGQQAFQATFQPTMQQHQQHPHEVKHNGWDNARVVTADGSLATPVARRATLGTASPARGGAYPTATPFVHRVEQTPQTSRTDYFGPGSRMPSFAPDHMEGGIPTTAPHNNNNNQHDNHNANYHATAASTKESEYTEMLRRQLQEKQQELEDIKSQAAASTTTTAHSGFGAFSQRALSATSPGRVISASPRISSSTHTLDTNRTGAATGTVSGWTSRVISSYDMTNTASMTSGAVPTATRSPSAPARAPSTFSPSPHTHNTHSIAVPSLAGDATPARDAKVRALEKELDHLRRVMDAQNAENSALREALGQSEGRVHRVMSARTNEEIIERKEKSIALSRIERLSEELGRVRRDMGDTRRSIDRHADENNNAAAAADLEEDNDKAAQVQEEKRTPRNYHTGHVALQVDTGSNAAGATPRPAKKKQTGVLHLLDSPATPFRAARQEVNEPRRKTLPGNRNLLRAELEALQARLDESRAHHAMVSARGSGPATPSIGSPAPRDLPDTAPTRDDLHNNNNNNNNSNDNDTGAGAGGAGSDKSREAEFWKQRSMQTAKELQNMRRELALSRQALSKKE